MSLREIILAVAEGWPEYRRAGVVDSDHHVYDLVVRQYPEQLRNLIDNPAGWEFTGSTGRGNVTAAPWVGTFDPAVTTSAQRGYYPVYLFSTDLQRVYLSFAIGVMQFEDPDLYPSRRDGRDARLRVTRQVRYLLRDWVPGRMGSGDLDLGDVRVGTLHDGYSSGSCFNYRYELSKLPDNSDLERDYRGIIEFYHRATHHPALASIENFAEIYVKEPELGDVLVDIATFEPGPPRKRGRQRGGGGRGTGETKKVGDAGENFVLQQEKLRLTTAGRSDLADKVDAHCQKQEFPGWDITSYEDNGEPFYIEVKATKGRSMKSIHVTENEYAAAKREGKKYRLYIVTRALGSPKIQEIRDPIAWAADWGIEITPSEYLFPLWRESDTDS